MSSSCKNHHCWTAVITTCRRPTFLATALGSVLAQSRPAEKIIIVDDSGDEENREKNRRIVDAMVTTSPSVRLLQTDAKRSRGISCARNLGIKETHTEWLAFLDDDDIWDEKKIATQLKETHASASRLCHTNEIWLRKHVRINPHKHHLKTGGHIYLRCLALCLVSPSSCFIHKSVFEDYGLFDEELPACEDYDMWLRICAYEPVSYVDEHLTVKRGGHANQLSRRYWGMDRFRVKALRKMMEQPQLKAEYREATKKMLIKKIGILQQGASKRGKREDTRLYAEQLSQWQ